MNYRVAYYYRISFEEALQLMVVCLPLLFFSGMVKRFGAYLYDNTIAETPLR